MSIVKEILPGNLKRFIKSFNHLAVRMSCPEAPEATLPLEDWNPNSVSFREKQEYNGVDWGIHLGQDCVAESGTYVKTIGRGKVVYSALHSTDEEPEAEGEEGSNWGNIIIIAHKHPESRNIFFSVYGHLQGRTVQAGDRVLLGNPIAKVAPGWTKENGWWREPHLHFAIYSGLWRGEVLPGKYSESENRTKIEDWEPPNKFVMTYGSHS